MSGWVVRAAGGGDLAGILELERATAGAPHWAEGDYRAVWDGAGAVKRCLLVAETEGRLGGFAVGKVLGLVGELESVVVSAEQRRQGIGLALCEAVVDWCRDQSAETLELEVRAGAAGAIALYEGLGWVRTGWRKGYYRDPAEDAVLMQMELRAG